MQVRILELTIVLICNNRTKLCTFNLYVRMKPNSLFKRTAGGCLLKSSPGLSGLVTPAELTCTNLRDYEVNEIETTNQCN